MQKRRKKSHTTRITTAWILLLDFVHLLILVVFLFFGVGDLDDFMLFEGLPQGLVGNG